MDVDVTRLFTLAHAPESRRTPTQAVLEQSATIRPEPRLSLPSTPLALTFLDRDVWLYTGEVGALTSGPEKRPSSFQFCTASSSVGLGIHLYVW